MEIGREVAISYTISRDVADLTGMTPVDYRDAPSAAALSA
jgi:hypothetical protein